MSELISGKEALIALANGEEVEYFDEKLNEFVYMDMTHHFNQKFRLKPRTITINGIEVPACGENYEYGNAMYILNSLEPEEYSLVVLDKVDEIPLYWWKSEEEIKQVVAALRSIFSNK